MALPQSYTDWPETAQQRYQELKKLAASTHDYINVTQDIMFRIQTLVRNAESIDPGDGSMFVCAGNLIKKKYLEQTY